MPPRPRDSHDALVDAQHNLRSASSSMNDEGDWATTGLSCGPAGKNRFDGAVTIER